MTMREHLLIAAALGTLTIGTPPVLAQSQDTTNPEAAASEEMTPGLQVQSEQEVPLADVPDAALAAAKGALDAEPQGASRVTLMEGEEVYQIEGTSAAGEGVAVYVTPAGEIMEGGTGQEEGSD